MSPSIKSQCLQAVKQQRDYNYGTNLKCEVLSEYSNCATHNATRKSCHTELSTTGVPFEKTIKYHHRLIIRSVHNESGMRLLIN
jgi:hypothetical protein